MELKKVCAFLVAAFFVVDVFLLVLCIQSNNNLLYLSGDMIDNAVSFIRAQDVTVEPSAIQRKIPDNAVYTFKADNTELAFGVASQLSDAFFSSAPVSFVETPDGVSYTIGKSAEAAASLRVYSDSFRFEYAQTGFSRDATLLPSEAFVSEEPTLSDRQKKSVDAFIEAFGIGKTRTNYTLCGVMPAENGLFVSLSQNVYADYPITEMFVNLYLSQEDEILSACGNRIFASPVRAYAPTLTDGVNALAAFDYATVTSIVSERVVYRHRYTGSTTHYLIPVWEIVYLDKDNLSQTRYVDTVKK